MDFFLGIFLLILGVISTFFCILYMRKQLVWQSNALLISTAVFIYGGVYFLVQP